MGKTKPKKVDQKILFRLWIDCSRWVYNRTVEYLKTVTGRRKPWGEIRTEEIYPQIPERFKDCPSLTKGSAVKEACTAYSQGKLKAQRTGRPFNLSFRSRKNPIQSCYINARALKYGGIYPRYSGKVRCSEDFPKDPSDSRLVLRNGKWYLSVPKIKKTTRVETQDRVVALDPGVRTFQTFFSEDSAGELGKADIGRIYRLCAYLDNLLSRASGVKDRTRKYFMRKAAGRIRDKIRNLVDELHFKTTRFLVDNFDYILIPSFEVSNMIKKGRRKLRRKSVRAMVTLSHYRFRQRLIGAAWAAGKVVVVVGEAWTSKTCSWSGEIISNLGGKKVIKGSDGISMSRDMNGARGIFLRALVDTPSASFLRGTPNDCLTSSANVSD